jgi:undecaprenyl-phosphate 4-deoxy-4-formamido-L-arabinose transferase
VDLSVVIPVYRSSATLRRLIAELLQVLDGLGKSYEVVLVDDGSPDDSWRVVRELQATYPDRVVAIQLMRNYGQHNALMCGFRHSRGQLIVTMDDDGQNPPGEIPRLVMAIESGDLDLVYGCPVARQHTPWRNAGSALVFAFYRITFRTRVTATPFRIIRRALLESIFTYNLNFTFIDGLLAWNTQRIGEITVAHHPRADGRSGYSPRKLLTLALNLFTNFSLLPLQLVSLLGFFTAVCGLVTAAFYLVKYLMHRIAVPGYASIIIAVLVLGGIQLLAIGVMGEYIGRLHLNVNRKPQYTERQVLGPPAAVENGEVVRPDESVVPMGSQR